MFDHFVIHDLMNITYGQFLLKIKIFEINQIRH